MQCVVYQGKVEFISRYIEIICCLHYRHLVISLEFPCKKKIDQNKKTG